MEIDGKEGDAQFSHFLQIFHSNSIFPFRQLQWQDYCYLISIEYDNVPMEVSFHFQKTRLKMSEVNKSNDLSHLHG